MIREMFKTMSLIWRHPDGRAVLALLLGIFGVGTVFYRAVEGWSWLDSLYFTVVTLTTVGYGDLTPTRAVSKGFTIILILIGVGLILGFLQFLVRQTAQRRMGDPGSD